MCGYKTKIISSGTTDASVYNSCGRVTLVRLDFGCFVPDHKGRKFFFNATRQTSHIRSSKSGNRQSVVCRNILVNVHSVLALRSVSIESSIGRDRILNVFFCLFGTRRKC